MYLPIFRKLREARIKTAKSRLEEDRQELNHILQEKQALNRYSKQSAAIKKNRAEARAIKYEPVKQFGIKVLNFSKGVQDYATALERKRRKNRFL